MRVCGGEEPTVSVLRGPMAQAGSASTSRIPQERGSLPQLERTEVVTDSCLSKGYLTYVLCGEAHFHAHGRCCQRECWRAWACPSTSSSHVLTAEIQTAPCRRLWAHDVVLNVEVPKGRWSIFLCGVSTSFLCPLKVCFGSISLIEWSCLFLFHHHPLCRLVGCRPRGPPSEQRLRWEKVFPKVPVFQPLTPSR